MEIHHVRSRCLGAEPRSALKGKEKEGRDDATHQCETPRSSSLFVAISAEKEHPSGRNQSPLDATEDNLISQSVSREQVRNWPGNETPSVKVEPLVPGE